MELMTSTSPDRRESEHLCAVIYMIFGAAWWSNLPDSAVHQFLDRSLGTEFLLHPNIRPAYNLVTSAARHNRSEHNQQFLESVARICNANPADVTRVLRIANTTEELAKLEHLVATKKIGLDGQFIDDAWDLIVEWLQSHVADTTELRKNLARLIGGKIGEYPWSTAIQLCHLCQNTDQSRLYTLVAVLKLRVQENDERRIKQQAANARRPRAKGRSQQAIEPSAVKAARSSSRVRKSLVQAATPETELTGSTDPSQTSRTSTPSPPTAQFPPAHHQLEQGQPTVTYAIPIGQSVVLDHSLEHRDSFRWVPPSVEPAFNTVQTEISVATPDLADSGFEFAPAASTELELAFMTNLYAYGTLSDYDVAVQSLALVFDPGNFTCSPGSSTIFNMSTLATDNYTGINQDTNGTVNDFSVGAGGWAVGANGPSAASSFSTIYTTTPSHSFPHPLDTSTAPAVSEFNFFDFDPVQAWIEPGALAPNILPQASVPPHDINTLSNDTTSSFNMVPSGDVPPLNVATTLSTLHDPEYSVSSAVAPLPAHSNFTDFACAAPAASDDEPPPLIPSPDYDDEDEVEEQIPDPDPAHITRVESVLRNDSELASELGDHENWRTLFWPAMPLSVGSQDSKAQLGSFRSSFSETANAFILPTTLPDHQTTGTTNKTSASHEASAPEPIIEPSLHASSNANPVTPRSQSSTIPESESHTASAKRSSEGWSDRDAPHQMDQVSRAHHSSLALPISDTSGPSTSTQDESRVVHDLLNAMRLDKPTSTDTNALSSQRWPQVIKDMRERFATGSDEEKKNIEEHFVRLCAKGGALDSVGGGHVGELAILLVALQSRPVMIGRALEGHTGPIMQLPVELYIPAHLEAAEFVFDGNLPTCLRSYREAKESWTADVRRFIAANTPLADRWADVFRRTIANKSDVEIDRLQTLYSNTVLPPINESVVSDPDAPPPNVRPAKVNGYVFLPEHPMLLRKRGVVLSNVDWIYRIPNGTDTFDFGHDTLLPQMVAPGHLYACAVRSPPDRPFSLHACTHEASLVAWVDVSLDDFDLCNLIETNLPMYRAGTVLSMALHRAVQDCNDRVDQWHRRHRHLHVEYPADLLEMTMAVYDRIVSDGVMEMEIEGVMEALQRLIRSLQSWWRYRALVDNLLIDRQRYAMETAIGMRRGPDVADMSSPSQVWHDVVGLFVRTWSEFVLFAQLNIPVWLITTVDDTWTTSISQMRIMEPPLWVLDRSAIQVSTMEERSLGEMTNLLDVSYQDDPTLASERMPSVTTTKKRCADFWTPGDKRRRTDYGFIASASHVPSRCPCCSMPDVEDNYHYGRPEYWHASRRIWCTQEEFNAVTPEQIGAPPPITQSFVFFDSWDHVITQPNLYLSRMRQFSLFVVSTTGPVVLDGVAEHLIPSALDTGLEMRQAAPPVRVFTAGRAHRRSQAGCAFLGMLDLIGRAVVTNPIDICGFPPTQWDRLLRVCSLDDFSNGKWWPHRTAKYFRRFGIQFSRSTALASGSAVQSADGIPSSALSEPTLSGTLDAPPELTLHLIAQLDERSSSGRRTGSEGYTPCFLTAAPPREHPLQPESRRSLYRPQHYLQLASGDERPIDHFHFFVQHGIVEGQFVFQCVPSAQGNELALNGMDTYVSYDHNAILIFDAFPHPHGRSASGEQILSNPVLLVDSLAVASCERRLSSLRVWHHWRNCAPAPTQHRNQVGSRLRTGPFSKHFTSACSSEPGEFLVVDDAFPLGRRPPSFAETFARPRTTVHFMGVPWPTWNPGQDSAGIPEAYEWLTGSHHELLLWIACNLLFFVSLISFDSMLRKVNPRCPRLARMPWSTRLALYQVLWGGPTPIPRLDAAQLVTHERYEALERRRPLIAALSQIVGAWPRVHLPPPPSPGEGREAFLAFEHCVWTSFLVTWLDYLRRPPPFPVPIPKDLPAEFSHIVPATGD